MPVSVSVQYNFHDFDVKVWDGEHDVGIVNNPASFTPSFGNHNADPNNSCYGNSHLENAGHVQVDDVSLGHNEVVFRYLS